MNKTPEISIVSPIYMAENIAEKLVEAISKSMLELGVSFEIILVDDRSPDNSWPVIKKLSVTHNHVKSIRLSRNFGQHAAIMAGLSQAQGHWIVVMDCDLQDQPKEIKKLYQKALEGYEVVLAKRTQRQDNALKKMSSKVFYKLFNYLAGVKIDNEIANFGIYKNTVIQSVLKLGDAHIFFPLFIRWVGYNQTAIAVEHAARDSGKSTYNLLNLIKLASNTIISFSDKPLRLFLNLGLIISLFSFIGALYVLVQAFRGDIEVMGYSSIFISICFFSGIIITTLGVLGIYLGKAFNQTKNRPIFIIDDTQN
ncbi:glycosyltransferase family 2 protein [Bizionia sediminis]|uniref:Glycosyltransferase family 2 protein n=1 Tax=Bizionia sediminis TaxID=1737064 RepID=A0ABW5KNF3_9FLAO